MSDNEPTGTRYSLQFQIIAFTPTGEPFQVVFHSPGKAGVADVETAKEFKAKLEQADVLIGRSRMYEIIPALVAQDFDASPMSDLLMGDDGKDVTDLPTTKPPASEPQSN
jgi:hypothetical protein